MLTGYDELQTDGPGFKYSNIKYNNIKRIKSKSPEFSVGPNPKIKPVEIREPKPKVYKLSKSISAYLDATKNPKEY